MFLKIWSFRSKINEIEIENSSQKFSIYFNMFEVQIPKMLCTIFII